jgi:hypothetical protein
MLTARSKGKALVNKAKQADPSLTCCRLRDAPEKHGSAFPLTFRTPSRINRSNGRGSYKAGQQAPGHVQQPG